MRTRNRNTAARRFVRLALPALAAVCVARARDTWYVAVGGEGDGSSPASPTNSLQGAIDACDLGGTVWLAPGVYEQGGVAGYPSGAALTSRVVIAKAVTVRGADGDPSRAVIRGRWDSPGTNGPGAIRGVYMAAKARLLNVTVTNGATMVAGSKTEDNSGGGICCQDTSAVISNCVIAGNSARVGGGGVFRGTLLGCELTGNTGYYGGGARSSTLSNCAIRANVADRRNGIFPRSGGVDGCTVYDSVLAGNRNLGYNGGGACDSTLYSCLLTNNHTTSTHGGAASGGTLHGCLLADNSAGRGGAALGSTFYNCLLTGNKCRGDDASAALECRLFHCTVTGNHVESTIGKGGALYACKAVTNCIVMFNTRNHKDSVANYYKGTGPGAFGASCVAPAIDGWADGNIAADPLFADAAGGDFRLRRTSPCRDGGITLGWALDPADARSRDLDRRPRVLGAAADMGAYEFVPPSPGTAVLVR